MDFLRHRDWRLCPPSVQGHLQGAHTLAPASEHLDIGLTGEEDTVSPTQPPAPPTFTPANAAPPEGFAEEPMSQNRLNHLRSEAGSDWSWNSWTVVAVFLGLVSQCNFITLQKTEG